MAIFVMCIHIVKLLSWWDQPSCTTYRGEITSTTMYFASVSDEFRPVERALEVVEAVIVRYVGQTKYEYPILKWCG
jgi:hypothetical protein